MRPVIIIPPIDAAVSPASALDGLARRVIFLLLGKLRHGCLTLVEDSQTLSFGEPLHQASLHAVITILDHRTYRRLLLAGSRGLGESYISGWWSADNVSAVIRILLKISTSWKKFYHPGPDWQHLFITSGSFPSGTPSLAARPTSPPTMTWETTFTRFFWTRL